MPKNDTRPASIVTPEGDGLDAPDAARAATDLPPAAPTATLPVEDHARARGHTSLSRPKAAWVFQSARARFGWVKGQEMTGAEYDARIAEALGQSYGG